MIVTRTLLFDEQHGREKRRIAEHTNSVRTEFIRRGGRHGNAVGQRVTRSGTCAMPA